MPTSRSGFPDPRRAGFTLVELVVVMVVLCILALVLLPRSTGCPRDARSNVLMQQGATFAKHLLTLDIQGKFPGDIYPSSAGNTFTTSTGFFEFSLEKEIFSHQDFSMFGGAGARPFKTRDPKKFNAENNAWSVVVDTGTTGNEQTPLLISRNLVLPGNRLPDGTLGEKGANLGALLKSTPDRLLSISREYLVVITRSASGNAAYQAKHLGPGTAHRLNPTAHRLPVLRP